MHPVTTPIVLLISEETEKKGVKLFLKRDDLVHPTIMGNKWRKLKYNLEEAKNLGRSTLLTFGGAYSNHIAATAAAAKEYGFKSIGIIRGEELNAHSNPTLQEAAAQGMDLRFIPREEFRVLKNDLQQVQMDHPDTYILPEGGTNALAVKGTSEIIDELTIEYDYLICPVGTGGTMAGLLSKLPSTKQLIGISSLKGDFVQDEFRKLMRKNQILNNHWTILEDYHFGGYARTTEALVAFINGFKKTHAIALDPVYTGKMMFAVYDLIQKGYFPRGSKIIALHTGGLQGIIGFNVKKGNLIL